MCGTEQSRGGASCHSMPSAESRSGISNTIRGGLVRVVTTTSLLLSIQPVLGFQSAPTLKQLRTTTTSSLLQSSYYPSSGSDAVVNGGSSAMPLSPRSRYYFEDDRRAGPFGGEFSDRDFPYQDPYMEGPEDRFMNMNMNMNMNGRGGRFEPGPMNGPPGGNFDGMMDGRRGFEAMNGRGGGFDGPMPPPPYPPPPMNNGGYDPQAQKYFNNNHARRFPTMNNGMMGDVPPAYGIYGPGPMPEGPMGGPGGMPGPGSYRDPRGPPPRPSSTFSDQQQVGQSQRYFNGDRNDGNNKAYNSVHDAEIYRDEQYYERIERLFPVLSRIQGFQWQGQIQYLDGDLQFSRQNGSNGRRQVGLRYDLEADGHVFLTITLSGRRIEMQGQRIAENERRNPGESPNHYYRRDERGAGMSSYSASSREMIRLEPMNDQDPNCMELVELNPDTVLINEIDRITGKVVLTASLSIANDDELVQVSHDVGDLDAPIESHQIWTLQRPGARPRPPAGSSQTSSIRHMGASTTAMPSSMSDGVQRNQVTTGIPQSITGRSQPGIHRGRSGTGSMARIYPVLAKFAGITWEGDCRQVNGVLRLAGMSRPLYGGSRYDIYPDGSVVLTTFLRSNGREQSIEMRGGRVNGPGSPIRLDMDRAPNSMIIAEIAPNTILMNEVDRETGRILFTASLFLASDSDVIQVSHQLSGRDPRMPVDLHQVWRLFPAGAGSEDRTEWRAWDQYQDRIDRSRDLRGGRSAWARGSDFNGRPPMYNGSTNAGRRSIGGLLTEPEDRSRDQYGDIDPSRDHLWLLNRSPEETRDRFRDKFNRWGGRREVLDNGFAVEDDDRSSLRQDHLLNSEIWDEFPVLSQITGIDWKGTCRYIIGDTKPDSMMLLKGGMRYDLSRDGVCTMTTTLVFGDGRVREVRMSGYRDRSQRYSNSMRLYPIDDEDDSVYAILTEISPDTILLNEVDSDTDKVIYTASLSISNDRNELVQVTHELGDGIRMPVEGHQVWRMQRHGGIYEKSPGLRKSASKWIPGKSSSMEELFPVLSKLEGKGWQGTFRFINGDLERQLNFEATGKMWYDLNRNGTCVLTIVSSLADGSSRYVQMKGERGQSAQEQIRLDPVDHDGRNYMLITELPPDTVLLSELDRFTGKLVSTASLSLYKDEVIQVSHEIGNSTRLDGHQIARLRCSKDRSSTSRGSMSALLNGVLQDPSYSSSDSLIDLFPVLNQIDGVNWQGFCRVVNDNMREEQSKPLLSGGMRYDLHRNGTCTMTSLLMHPDGRTHQIRLQGKRVGKSSKRSIRLDPVEGDSPFYTVLTEIPPDTILLNEVDKATNKVIFTASVSIANEDELVQISHDVDANGMNEDGHKIWRLKRSPVLGKKDGARAPQRPASYNRGQGFRTNRPPSGAAASPGGFDPSSAGPSRSFGTADVPFGQPKPKDPNVMFDF